MRLKYELFGILFDIIYNNKKDIEVLLNNLPGRYEKNDRQTMAKFEIRRVDEKTIDQSIESTRFDNIKYVNVEPTGGVSEVFYVGGEIICTYRGYYYIRYCFDKCMVQFYYSARFKSIAQLFPEFFKYYAFKFNIGQGLIPIHSSCIQNRKTNKKYLFVGESGSGKSSISLLTSLIEEFIFCNDEITYVACTRGSILAYSTNDMVKICPEMFEILSKGRTLEYKVTTDNEFLCNVDFLKSDCLKECSAEVDAIYLLERNDDLSDIEFESATVLEAYKIMLNNSNISIWTDADEKKIIVNTITKMIKSVEIKMIKYPISKIGEIHEIIQKKRY